MGQILSAYKRIFAPISLHQKTMDALNDLQNRRRPTNFEIQEFQIDMIVTRNLTESFYKDCRDHALLSKNPVLARKTFIDIHSKYRLEKLEAAFDLKNKICQTFVESRKDYNETVTVQYIEGIKNTLDDYMADVLTRDYQLILMSLKAVKNFEEHDDEFEYVIDNDYELNNLEDDLPLWKATFIGWFQSEKDEKLKTNISNLIEYLEGKLKEYIVEHTQIAAQTPATSRCKT